MTDFDPLNPEETMPTGLPIATLPLGTKNIKFFVDSKLKELRNIHNPHDRIPFAVLTVGQADQITKQLGEREWLN